MHLFVLILRLVLQVEPEQPAHLFWCFSLTTTLKRSDKSPALSEKQIKPDRTLHFQQEVIIDRLILRMCYLLCFFFPPSSFFLKFVFEDLSL